MATNAQIKAQALWQELTAAGISDATISDRIWNECHEGISTASSLLVGRTSTARNAVPTLEAMVTEVRDAQKSATEEPASTRQIEILVEHGIRETIAQQMTYAEASAILDTLVGKRH